MSDYFLRTASSTSSSAAGSEMRSVADLRWAAELGSVDAMAELCWQLWQAKDIEGAELWSQKAADAGNKYAMNTLALVLEERGDLKGAEHWYRKSAAAHYHHAMRNLGLLLRSRGEFDEAEHWFRRAIAQGNGQATTNLGTVLQEHAMALREQGDLERAVELLREAAELGDQLAMFRLAYLLNERGETEEAEVWYRKLAGSGNVAATSNLGTLLKVKGDLSGAEEMWQKAAEAGHAPAMRALGIALRNRGDLVGAEEWLRRAADLGDQESVDALGGLRRMIEYSDHQLKLVSFTDFGWELRENVHGRRVWVDGEDLLIEGFVDAAPDLPSLDPREIREGIVATQKLMHAPGFDPETDLPEEFREFFRDFHVHETEPLEIEVIDIGTAKCVRIETREATEGTVRFQSQLLLPYAEKFWFISISLRESDPVGEREGAVARQLLEAKSASALLEPFAPYDRRWDGLTPIEDDPLTRLRILTRRLLDSLHLDTELNRLEPFPPPLE